MTHAAPTRSGFEIARTHVRARVPGPALILTALLAVLAPAARAAPPAGSAIDNTASSSGVDSLSGAGLNVTSNLVRTLVQPLEALTLSPGTKTFVIPGTRVTFTHRLVNVGNVATDVRLDLAAAGPDFTLGAFAIVHDRDRDGLPGALDTPIAPGGVVTIAAGDSADLLVSALVPADARGLSRGALTLAATGLGRQTTVGAADTAETGVVLGPPALAFYSGADYGTPTHATTLDAPLFVQANAPRCNLDPTLPDTVRITLSSLLTGDSGTYDAIETGPSTGFFRIAGVPVTSAPLGLTGGPASVLHIQKGDEITALLAGCGAVETRANVWVEPGGTVFDSRTNAPVAGARVQLVDLTGAGNGGAAGAPAAVWGADGTTAAPADVVTGDDGRFVFPVVHPSRYQLLVTPPAPWRFPSRLPPSQIAFARTLDAAGSYDGPFDILQDNTPILLDVPLDRDVPTALFAEKSASRAVAEWGDDVDYRVRVANRSDTLLSAVTLQDQLPAGFLYVRGSARLQAAPLADPRGGAGPALAFAIGTLAPGAEATLEYRVRVGPGAPAGEARNIAIAEARTNRSNTAIASVRIEGDAFADDGMVVGTVWYDADRDGRMAQGESGLGGVRLYLDDGTFAVTDDRGRYRFAGLTPRTHALKLDATTLPPAAALEVIAHRGAGTPGVRFVDLTRGDLVRADFAAVGDTALMREAAGQRRQALAAASATEGGRLVARGAEALAAPAPLRDPRALPASGLATGERDGVALAVRADLPVMPPTTTAASASSNVALDQLLPGLDPDLGFVGLDDLDTVTTDQIAVVVKGPLGATLALRVNGKVLPESRVGRRFSAARAGLEAWEYVGVGLQPGLNVLEVAPPRSVGRVAVRVIAPGAFARLTLAAPRAVPADGHSIAALTLRASDAAGVPYGARTLLTLDGPAARFAVRDLDPSAPGLQISIENGVLRVPLVAPATPGDVRVLASAGEVHAAATVTFVPDLRPMLAVGSAEGVVSLQRLRRGADAQPVPRDGFEAPLGQFLSEARDGGASAAAHGAVFMKGRVRDNLLLTLGYDSDRPDHLRQFRDQQPERGYPVFGDASARGWDAQSTGHLYARIEQPQGSLLYGDFVTGGAGTRTLANYSRSLTGTAAHWERNGAALDAFTSRDHSRRVVEELRGLGTSGPYVLTRLPLLEGSERVEIVVRDRAQPGIVLTTTARQRYTDYELEPLTGRLIFRAPVPSVDENLNPVFVRLTYETASGGVPAWVHGVEGRVRLGERLEAGATFVDDHDPAAPYELRGLSAAARLGSGATLDAEWAATRHDGGAAGDAARLEFKQESARGQARVWGVSTGTGFDNPGAGYAGGRSEAGARLDLRTAGRTHLSGEALFSADALGHDKRSGLLLAVDRALTEALRGEFGVRFSRDVRRGAPAESPGAALRAKLAAQWPKHPEWAGYGEFEQDTREGSRRMAAVGGDYRFSPRGRVYARHELISSLSSAWALSGAQQQNASVAGIDADLTGSAHLFSEYRLGDALGGRDAQAAVGLRNAWALNSGLRVGGSFERVSPLGGSKAGPTTALTGSVDFTDGDTWKGSSRAEVRTSRASDQFLQSMSAAIRLDSAWTALGRHLLTLTDSHGGGAASERLQLAFAYRTGRTWDALARWELRYDREAPLDAARHRRVANIAGITATGRLHQWEPSLAWAGKLTRDQQPGFITAGGAQWLHGRLTRDLGESWDLGLAASALAGRRIGERRYGLGLETGRQLPGGLWVSLGFNRFGYVDDELAGEEWTRTGAYLRMRVKFDETPWRKTLKESRP